MDEQQRKAWTKQDGEDASRLLAEMVKRAKDASGGVRPEQIQESGGVRRVPANENREKPVEQRGGVSRSTGSCVAGGCDDGIGRCVVNRKLKRQGVDLTGDTHHAPNPSERVGPIDRGFLPPRGSEK